MIITATLSKPSKNIIDVFGKEYVKARFFYNKERNLYEAEFFTEKQAFQKTFSIDEFEAFMTEHRGTTFKNCTERTEDEIITTLSNKKGKITTLRQKLKAEEKTLVIGNKNLNRKKNYIIEEGSPVPFLVELGVMGKDGEVLKAKYDKFRQINHFLTFIDDVFPELAKLNRKINIADFGCGKSYLTFAVYHYLHEIKKLDVEIFGLDLKADVIAHCATLAKKLGYSDLHFSVGDIAKYTRRDDIDMVITLHACDTATDFALSYAVKHNAHIILSVPCCQHELNAQFDEHKKEIEPLFAPLMKYGIIKERFSALVTDALRAEYLEKAGFSVQLLEFIDMEHTPKNILIRAVKKSSEQEKDMTNARELEQSLCINPMIKNLL